MTTNSPPGIAAAIVSQSSTLRIASPEPAITRSGNEGRADVLSGPSRSRMAVTAWMRLRQSFSQMEARTKSSHVLSRVGAQQARKHFVGKRCIAGLLQFVDHGVSGGALVFVVGARPRVGEHQALHAVGMSKSKGKRDIAAHG